MKTIASIFQRFDTGCRESIDRHCERLSERIRKELPQVSDDLRAYTVATFRQDAEAKVARHREQLRLEAFDVVDGGL
jgi:hypothetical protein